MKILIILVIMDWQKIINWLKEPIPNISITIFRIVFSGSLLIQTYYFISTGFIDDNIVKPFILFPFISGLEPMSNFLLKGLSYIMLISNIGMLFNRFARISILIFLICFTYFWLLDKGYFNNHYYFISLMCFLLFLVDRKSAFSTISYTPRISLFCLQAMVFIVYFVAGINKLNPYWLLDLQPMTHILELKATITNNPTFSHDLLIMAASYFGLIFDLCIGFLLFLKRTRKIAFILAIGFHVMNYYLFYNVGEIGVFPLIMLSTLILFISPKKLSQLFKLKKSKNQIRYSKGLYGFIIVFLMFQVILPFRHILIPGYVDYTGVGQRFSWRMKIMYKNSDIRYFIINKNSDEKYEVHIEKMLTPKQYNNLKYFPDLIIPLAKRIKLEAVEKYNIMSPKITCIYKTKFMGKYEQLLFSPDLDIATIPEKQGAHKWMFPLKKSNSKN